MEQHRAIAVWPGVDVASEAEANGGLFLQCHPTGTKVNAWVSFIAWNGASR
jgi:hypothetical protein